MVRLDNDWDELLRDEFKKEYYLRLREFLKREYSTQQIFPDMHNIFLALKLCPHHETKIVILGQDPYHGPGQAHGLSFSVQPGVDAPPSLQNIYKELKQDLGCFIPNNGYLVPWARQGVLLLNASLTVRAGAAASHRNMGWEQFTDRVIELVNEKHRPVVFLLWGNHAREKASLVKEDRHLILTSVHPSPLSAHRGFLGCRHFSHANNFLVEHGLSPIDWQIPNI